MPRSSRCAALRSRERRRLPSLRDGERAGQLLQAAWLTGGRCVQERRHVGRLPGGARDRRGFDRGPVCRCHPAGGCRRRSSCHSWRPSCLPPPRALRSLTCSAAPLPPNNHLMLSFSLSFPSRRSLLSPVSPVPPRTQVLRARTGARVCPPPACARRAACSWPRAAPVDGVLSVQGDTFTDLDTKAISLLGLTSAPKDSAFYPSWSHGGALR